MKTYIVMNNKGGVGKTTTSDQLAAGLANAGYRTLLIDFDPQANTTDIFVEKQDHNFEKFLRDKLELEHYSFREFAQDFDREQELDYDIADCMMDPSLTKKAILTTRIPNLDLLPSSIQLSVTDTKIRLDGSSPQHNRLQRIIQTVKGEYDYCVVDCPPILNILTVNALNACDEVIIPIKVDVGALKGFFVTFEYIQQIIEGYQLDIDMSILFTMVNRNNVDKLTIELFKKICKDNVFVTTIRNQAKAISQAGFEQNLVINDLKANVGQDYRDLINEIISKEKAGV